MFEPLPEKPPHMAGKWLMLFGVLGAAIGVGVVGLVFGSEAMQSNVVLFGSGGAGILLGVIAGWKLIMPASSRPPEEPPL